MSKTQSDTGREGGLDINKKVEKKRGQQDMQADRRGAGRDRGLTCAHTHLTRHPTPLRTRGDMPDGGWINGWMSGGGWADEWMEQPGDQKQKLTKGLDREKFRCLLLAPPVLCSTLLLCSRRLTALTTASGLPALWVPVGFGPWAAPAGD